MIIKDEILKKENDFNALCKSHKVKFLYAFGSSTNSNFNYKESDIDLLVEIDDMDPIERDSKTQSAVERQLGIIGEAINKFERLYPKSNIDNDRKIVGLRNRLIHTYDSIDSSIIWAIIKNHLSPLKSEVFKFIKE